MTLKDVPCVKYRDGWCATASGRGFNPTRWSVKTLCGYYIYLSWGGERRLPDCPLCMIRLRRKQSKKPAKAAKKHGHD